MKSTMSHIGSHRQNGKNESAFCGAHRRRMAKPPLRASPERVANGDWETVPIKGVIPGVGFVPGEPHSPKGFDQIPEDESVWL